MNTNICTHISFFPGHIIIISSVLELVETNLNVHTNYKIMLKINLKTIAGLFVAVAIFASAQAVQAWTATMSAKITKASSSADVMWLQQTLNAVQGAGLVEDGKYGAKTTAAIKVFQSAHPTAGTADGIAGRLTIAALNAAGANLTATSTVPGCAAGAMFSSTSGLSCSGAVVSTVPGCVPGAMFSATTGASCSGSTTTVNSGTNGYLADLNSDSSNRVSTVYESEQNKVVAGFRATARLADQSVTRARVTFKNTNATASANLGRYISGATLWRDSTALQTMAVGQADRSTSDDTYTFNFSGFNSVIARDQIGHFYVSVNANGALDTNDTSNANWTVSFVAGGVNASSPDGTYDTYPTTAITQTGVLFGKFSSNGVKSEINLSSTNPSATVLTAQNTAATNGVTLLKFTVKATNSNLNLRKVPVQLTVVGATTPNAIDVGHVINTLKLYRGTDLVDTADGSAGYRFTAGSASNTTTACTTGVNNGDANDATCAFFFSNLSSSSTLITAGTTAEFTVVADLKQVNGNYTEGTTVSASIVNADVLLSANYSVQDTNGDQLTNNSSSIRVGSAVGQIMTLRVNGVNVVQGAATISKITDQAGITTSVTYDIPLTVTSFGNTLYTGQAAELATAASGTGAAAKAFSFALQDATAPATDIVVAPAATAISSTLASSDATIENLGFRLDSGSTKHFNLQVIVGCTAASCAGAATANYRVHVLTVRTDSVSSLAAPTNAALLPAQNYQTGYVKIK